MTAASAVQVTRAPRGDAITPNAATRRTRQNARPNQPTTELRYGIPGWLLISYDWVARLITAAVPSATSKESPAPTVSNMASARRWASRLVVVAFESVAGGLSPCIPHQSISIAPMATSPTSTDHQVGMTE